MSPTTPSAWRSCGMRATPARTQSRGRAGRARPSSARLPASSARRPCIRSARARWPLPATPATATTSPACSSRLMASSSGRGPLPRSVAPARRSTRGPCWRRVRATGATSRPTMASASPWVSAPAVGRSATSLPARSTATRWATASTSSSLWLMNTMARPAATNCFSVLNSVATSGGVSTAVGSSRIRMRVAWLRSPPRLPLTRALRISTRWRSPTDRSPTRASGCTARPKRCAASSKAARACARCERQRHSGSVPPITLSSTLRLSASVKCWCTMPMPAARAARGEPGGSGWPNTRMWPASAL